VVALAALVVFPNLEDRELGYPLLMLEFLPPFMLGLVVASLVAAFMSTVSTLINWGASYLTNDLYGRFMRPEATQAELVTAGRMASVLVTVLGAIAAFFSEDVTTIFRSRDRDRHGAWPGADFAVVLVAHQRGGGIVVHGGGVCDWSVHQRGAPGEDRRLWSAAAGDRGVNHGDLDHGDGADPARIGPVTLDRFYIKVRPAGPGWAPQRQRLAGGGLGCGAPDPAVATGGGGHGAAVWQHVCGGGLSCCCSP
jgi:SSS family solute:Na+ symporter